MTESASEDNVRQLFRTVESEIRREPSRTSGGGGSFDDMDKERLARLEGAFDGVKQSQAIMIGTVAIVSALLLGSTLYLVSRVDQLSSQVSDLPGKISSEIRDLSSALAGNITAAKQTPPQVILLPAPQQPKEQK